MSRRSIDSLGAMRELHGFLRGMVAWVGFPQICVRYERQARAAGETKYPLRKMIRLAWTAATSFSILQLKAITLLGVFVMLMGLEETLPGIPLKVSNSRPS
jgi:hypothetical protein